MIASKQSQELMEQKLLGVNKNEETPAYSITYCWVIRPQTNYAYNLINIVTICVLFQYH